MQASCSSLRYVYSRAEGQDHRSELLARVRAECGGLDGVIDASAILRDAFVAKKSDPELAAIAGSILAVALSDWRDGTRRRRDDGQATEPAQSSTASDPNA